MNNETKHTAGNWIAKDGQIYAQETGETLALIPYFEKGNEEQEANQKIIAAAPDLLEALSNAQEQIEYLQSKLTPSKRDFTKPTTNVCMEQIRAAIGKAIHG